MTDKERKFGVLLLNMGGPGNLDEVREYIFNLLADPFMVRIPLGNLLQKPFARMVSRKRAPKVIKRYELIGGRSPIDEATREQARLLSESIGLPVGYAMRYTPPGVDTATVMLTKQGVDSLVVIPLYPQYSTVSTLSSIKDFEERNATGIRFRIVDRHYDNPIYIEAMSRALENTLSKIDPTLKTCVLFAAHSIPEAYIRSGDPYADEVERTAESICKFLNLSLPHTLAYQSRVGPVKWRGPAVDEELVSLVKTGYEQLVVQPLSFVSENLETLFDLDIDFKESCDRLGIKSMFRVPTLGSSKLYIDALADIITRTINEWSGDDA